MLIAERPVMKAVIWSPKLQLSNPGGAYCANAVHRSTASSASGELNVNSPYAGLSEHAHTKPIMSDIKILIINSNYYKIILWCKYYL